MAVSKYSMLSEQEIGVNCWSLPFTVFPVQVIPPPGSPGELIPRCQLKMQPRAYLPFILSFQLSLELDHRRLEVVDGDGQPAVVSTVVQKLY